MGVVWFHGRKRPAFNWRPSIYSFSHDNDRSVQDHRFVSQAGTDLCVQCGADTGVLTTKDIRQRAYYVEGIGQFCMRCHG